MSQKKASPQAQYTQEEYLRRRKRRKLALIALLVLIAAGLGVFLWQSTQVRTGNISGTYYSQLNASSPYVFYLDFDNAAGTYTAHIDSDESGGGTYRVSGTTLTTREKSSGAKTTYDIAGEYLLDRDYYYQETLPEGDTFDASITQVTDVYTITVQFSADGTYTSSVLSEGEEEPAVSSGTYQREGNLIHRFRMAEDGTETAVPDLLVLDGKVNSHYYQKAPEEDSATGDSSLEASQTN